MMAVCKPFDIVSITNYFALSDVYSMNFTVLISSVAISTYFLIVKYFLKHIIVVTNYPFNLIQTKNKQWEVFFTTKEISYDLRIKNLLQIPNVKTSSYGQSSLSFRGSIHWNTLSDSIKSSQNIKGFKAMIRNWKGESCSCIVCK